MNTGVIVSAIAASCAVVLWLPSRHADRRLRRLSRYRPELDARAHAKPHSNSTVLRQGSGVLAGIAVALLVGGVAGVVAGVAVTVMSARALSRLEPEARRARREAIARDAPIALDLLAACLTAGTPVPDAVAAVGHSLGGPLGEDLRRVRAALELGMAPGEAWHALPDELAVVGRSFARAMSSGAPIADVAAALADERRAALQTAAAAGARRAGVAVVGPLGLCFLPAFIGTAVVPVVAGLAVRVLG